MSDTYLAQLGGLWSSLGQQPSSGYPSDQGALWNTLTNNGKWLVPDKAPIGTQAPTTPRYSDDRNQQPDNGDNTVSNAGSFTTPSEQQAMAQTHGLLGHIAAGVHHILGGLLGTGAASTGMGDGASPNPTPALYNPASAKPSANVRQTQPPPNGAIPTGGQYSSNQFQGQQQPTQMPQATDIPGLMKRIQPNWWQVTQEAAAEGKGRAEARQNLISMRLNEAMLPYQIASQQANMRYIQGIQDPQLRYLAMNNPQAFADLIKQRQGQTDVANGHTVYGAGPNGNQTLNGAETLSPGQTLTNTAGAPIMHAPAAPMTVAPSNSVANGDTGKITGTAPAAPMLVQTQPGQSSDIVYPGTPGLAGGASGSGSGGGQATGTLPGASAPPNPSGASRGMRNNNPWNVTPLGKGQWNGQTGTDGDFAQFDTPQAGARAADLNLQNYAKLHGIDTVRGIVSRWAPDWQHETPTYVQAVSDALGVKPDQHLDIATNSQTRASLLHAMLPIETGRTGAQQAQAAGVGGQPGATPAQASSGQPGVQAVRQGAMPRDIPAAEAISRGLAPGKWQQLPNGDYKLSSPAPKGDVDRVNNLNAAASTMDDLLSLDNQFMQSARRTNPGLQYAGGDHFNPIAKIGELTNPDVKTMESIGSQELFKMKPENAGARILQSELPFWQRSALDAGSTLQANEGLADQHRAQAAEINQKSQFYNNWLYEHGNLNGADQGWQQVRKQQAQSSAPKKRASVVPSTRAPALPPSGGFSIVQ